MEIGKQKVSAVIPTTNDELEGRFMSVHVRLHSRTFSYLLAQILILAASSRDSLAVRGISVAVSLVVTLTVLDGLVTDLAEFTRIRFLMDLNDSVLSRTHRVDLPGEFRRVEGRDLRRRLVSGVYLAAIIAFAAVMLWACWVIGPES